MTRRDLIIVAVLANIGVLAILFMMAFRSEENSEPMREIAFAPTEETVNIQQPPVEVPVKPEPTDVIDAALEEEGLNQTPEDHFQLIEPETHPEVSQKEEPKPELEAKFVEVTIKRGDALEKIARANGTTVAAIMKANDLQNDRLRIGQVLKVPVGTRKKAVVEAKAPEIASVEYYTVKSGDNPWKIAKQFNMKLDELLKLNNLNEERARNLKVGDTIRVK